MLIPLLDTALEVCGLQRIASVTTAAAPGMANTVLPVARNWWSGSSSLLPFIPKPLKAIFLLLILLNIKSVPLLWHLKIWGIAYAARIQANWLGPAAYYRFLGVGVGRAFRTTIRAGLENEKSQYGHAVEAVGVVNGDGDKATANELAHGKDGSLIPIPTPKSTSKPYKFFSRYHHPESSPYGHRFEHPLAVTSKRQYRAAFDDCDYNLHLSNSSYAKNLDHARMQSCVDCFSPFFAPKGWMALGAAHYGFVREIEIGSEYEIRFGIAGWEDKWIYFVGEFVTYPKGKKAKQQAGSESTAAPDASTSTDGRATETAKGKPRSKELPVRADGSVLHCSSISTYCFKLGRITIPPAVVLSFCGYGDPSNWVRAQRLLAQPDKGKAWLQGGYKDEAVKVGSEWEAEAGTAIAEACAKGKQAGGLLKEGLEGLMSNWQRVEKSS